MSQLTDTLQINSGNPVHILMGYIERSLINSYKYPKREYHNWNHVIACLKELESYPDSNHDEYNKDLIAIAIYYHDCIYDPKKDNNEELSAERAFIDLKALGYTLSLAMYVYDLIMLTKHKGPCNFLSGQVLMDIDMSILGKDSLIFLSYELHIREEYNFLSVEEYRPGRINFLQSVLDKKCIYQTNFFRDKYEEAARENIKTLIKALTPVKFIH